jgi:hypothetical protein
MTECFSINMYCILCLVTHYLPGLSHDKDKMAQAYDTSFGWARAHRMKHKAGDAHETLSLVFQQNSVPPTMVTHDSKEQTKGEF